MSERAQLRKALKEVSKWDRRAGVPHNYFALYRRERESN